MTDERDGDADSIPLSDLRADLDAGDGDRTDRGNDATGGADETDDSGQPDMGGRAAEEESQHTDDSVPLSGLRDEMNRKTRDDREREQAVAANAFMEETVEPVDSDGVWADLLMESENPEGHFEASETQDGVEGPTQVISKRICERCRYLEAPPNLECTHEGTTIHELVDMDHVRVSSCPMVGPDGKKTRPDGSRDE